METQLADAGLRFGAPVFIRIFKEEKKLELWIKKESRFHLFKNYPICTYGQGTTGPKIREGDGQAPEGFYYVPPGQLNPSSDFHLSFNIGYPNRYDRANGRTGSAIMVHGNCVSIGCFAMTDEKIEEIYTVAAAALQKTEGLKERDKFVIESARKRGIPIAITTAGNSIQQILSGTSFKEVSPSQYDRLVKANENVVGFFYVGDKNHQFCSAAPHG